MNILYIHGYASDENTTTGKLLEKYLPEHNVFHPTIPCEDTFKQFIERYIADNNIELIIGSSLGGFMALNIFKDYIPRIVINPCMQPSVELLKIGCNISTAEIFKPYEQNMKVPSKDYQWLTFGIFGVFDEFLDYKRMIDIYKQYGYSLIYTTEMTHRATETDMKNKIIPIIKDIINIEIPNNEISLIQLNDLENNDRE